MQVSVHTPYCSRLFRCCSQSRLPALVMVRDVYVPLPLLREIEYNVEVWQFTLIVPVISLSKELKTS